MNKKELMSIVHGSLQNTIRELQRVDTGLSADELETVIKALIDCEGKVVVTGVGTSGAAARKITHSLSCIELPATYLSPGNGIHGASGMIQPGDVLIVLSKGGKSAEVNKLCSIAGKRGAVRIAVTESLDNPLAKESEIVLRVQVETESDKLGLLATASTTAVISAFDAICSVIMHQRDFTEENFALIHPEGAVGQKLTKERQDNE